MDIETKIELIKSEPTEEIVTERDLRTLLESNEHPKQYDGFEIGMLHLGHVFIAGKKINDLEKAGVKTQVLLADWHTMANNKMGGDWERIIKASKVLMKIFETACPNTKIILGSELYKDNDEYWKTVMRIARRTTMARATRTLIIQGRSEKDTLHVSQYIYPIMQAADILALGADIPLAGMDQRRVHMLAKETFEELGFRKIVPVHLHLLAGLLEPPNIQDKEKEEIVAEMKMSKSKPGSGISVVATDEEVHSAIKTAWCPGKVVDRNPILELCRYMIIPVTGHVLVERKSEHGGDMDYPDYKGLEEDFRNGKLHPLDLKNAVERSVITMIEPIRKQFRGNNAELLDVFKQP
jgi:tyrosyl-tRNA synthetase